MKKIIICYILVSVFVSFGCQKKMTEVEKKETEALFKLAMEANKNIKNTGFIFFVERSGRVLTAALPLSPHLQGQSVVTMSKCYNMVCSNGDDRVIILRYVDKIITNPLSEEGVKAWKVFAKQ